MDRGGPDLMEELYIEVSNWKSGEDSDEDGGVCRTNESREAIKDGMCSPGEWKEDRKTVLEVARFHREGL